MATGVAGCPDNTGAAGCPETTGLAGCPPDCDCETCRPASGPNVCRFLAVADGGELCGQACGVTDLVPGFGKYINIISFPDFTVPFVLRATIFGGGVCIFRKTWVGGLVIDDFGSNGPGGDNACSGVPVRRVLNVYADYEPGQPATQVSWFVYSDPFPGVAAGIRFMGMANDDANDGGCVASQFTNPGGGPPTVCGQVNENIAYINTVITVIPL